MGRRIFLCICLLLACTDRQPNEKAGEQPYHLVKNWPALPDTLQMGNPAGIGVDTSQNLFVFRRGSRDWPLFGSMPTTTIAQKTVLLLDNKTGKMINSWGDHLFVMPHGLTIDSANNVWLTDVGLHQVFKFTHEGKLLLKLGIAGVPGNDATHFNQPTDVAIAADGSFYVSDGYGNSRVVKFSATGKYLFEFGKKGGADGEFRIPHGLTLDQACHIYVADRENNRIEVFNAEGKFLKQFRDESFGRICGITFDKVHNRLIAVDDPTSWFNLRHNGSSVIVLDTAGRVLYQFPARGAEPKTWYHDVAVDKYGNIYTADILDNRLQKFEAR